VGYLACPTDRSSHQREGFYRHCFRPLITTKFRQAFEPHINHMSTGPRRGALKPSGGLLVAFSGGLGSSVLLDLVHRVYCANVGSDELKGGKEHPRRNKVWEKIHVCYVETSDAFPEASPILCDSFPHFLKPALDERPNCADTRGCRSLRRMRVYSGADARRVRSELVGTSFRRGSFQSRRNAH
jgi:hypothetical protein